MTLFQHRLTIICPAAKVPSVVTWINTNIGPNTVPPDLGPGLNATGIDTDPITHRWCCGSFTAPQCKEIFAKLCQVASVPPPKSSDWDNATQSEKITVVNNLKKSLKSGAGLYVGLAENRKNWEPSEAALAGMGLRTIGAKSVAKSVI